MASISSIYRFSSGSISTNMDSRTIEYPSGKVELAGDPELWEQHLRYVVIDRFMPKLSDLGETRMGLLYSNSGLTLSNDTKHDCTICFKTVEKADRLFVTMITPNKLSYFCLEYHEKGENSAVVIREVHQTSSRNYEIMEPTTQLKKDFSKLLPFEELLKKRQDDFSDQHVNLNFRVHPEVIQFTNQTEISHIEEIRDFFKGTVLEESFSQLDLERQVRFETQFMMIPTEVRESAKELLTVLNQFPQLKDGIAKAFENYLSSWKSVYEFSHFIDWKVVDYSQDTLGVQMFRNKSVMQVLTKFITANKKADEGKAEEELCQKKAEDKKLLVTYRQAHGLFYYTDTL